MANTLLFAVKWWAQNLAYEAQQWLGKANCSPADQDAVRDAVIWAKSAQHFKWVRDSRILFWWLPMEWHADFRDGVRIWCLPHQNLPEGYPHNIPD